MPTVDQPEELVIQLCATKLMDSFRAMTDLYIGIQI